MKSDILIVLSCLVPFDRYILIQLHQAFSDLKRTGFQFVEAEPITHGGNTYYCTFLY